MGIDHDKPFWPVQRIVAFTGHAFLTEDEFGLTFNCFMPEIMKDSAGRLAAVYLDAELTRFQGLIGFSVKHAGFTASVFAEREGWGSLERIEVRAAVKRAQERWNADLKAVNQ